MAVYCCTMTAARRPLLPARRHIAAWVALLGLAFHGLLPLSYNAMQRAMADAARSEGGIEQLVICTALGLRTVEIKDGLPVDSDSTAPKKAERSCPICLAAAGQAHALLPASLLLALPAALAATAYVQPDYTAPDQASWLPPQARAPPASPL
jgi:hypothetical protein